MCDVGGGFSNYFQDELLKDFTEGIDEDKLGSRISLEVAGFENCYDNRLLLLSEVVA